MSRSKTLAARLGEVLLNGRWIANTNYKDQLLRIDWKQAKTRIGTLNTIAHLAFHINYYLGGILNVLNGGALEIHDRFSFDLPEITNEQDWDKLLNEFLFNAETFVKKVEQMTNEQLDAVFVDAKYGTYLRNIEGVIEHCYYHLGQISLISKMIKETKE
ncbi:MAG: DUF1572 domain-containing protein [Lacibacter sp.]